MHASISSFMPPLEELTDLKNNEEVTDNTKQNEDESANPMDTGNPPNDTAQLGGNITPTHPTDGYSHKRDSDRAKGENCFCEKMTEKRKARQVI